MPAEPVPQKPLEPRRKREPVDGKPNQKFALTPEQHEYVVRNAR